MISLTATSSLVPRRRRYLSTSVVAARLGVTPRTVRLWAESYQIPAIKIGRQWRIDDASFDEWLSQ
jgi:excisionase family DNA binding protein